MPEIKQCGVYNVGHSLSSKDVLMTALTKISVKRKKCTEIW